MSGRLIGVVGPSGAGKDTVMQAMVATRPDMTLVRRVITRPAGSGGEDHQATTDADFERRRTEGAFCLWWRAHGLSYGIPNTVLAQTRLGGEHLVNLSRAVLADAQRIFPDFVVMNVTASPETLAARLGARGREAADQIDARLQRSAPAWPEGVAVLTVENEGPLDDTVRRALTLLHTEKV